MPNHRTTGLLTAMSIVMIVVGCLQLAGGLITANIGGLVTIAGAGSGAEILVTVGIMIIVLSLIVGIFSLVSGILTLQRRGLGFGMFVSIAAIVIELVFMIVFLIAGSDTSAVAMCLISFVISILYLIGIVRARQM
ncbi:MAG: hypothetical protein HDQ87_05270 [Clostridia bacterium]|nr:hypothetical protein [Clostridia bacterium]